MLPRHVTGGLGNLADDTFQLDCAAGFVEFIHRCNSSLVDDLHPGNWKGKTKENVAVVWVWENLCLITVFLPQLSNDAGESYVLTHTCCYHTNRKGLWLFTRLLLHHEAQDVWFLVWYRNVWGVGNGLFEHFFFVFIKCQIWFKVAFIKQNKPEKNLSLNKLLSIFLTFLTPTTPNQLTR